MAERSHLSIGEVLTLLREEFPDVTISKIRFLESQGLVDPERTPSGYRKFYDPDVERLRWILRQQREHFLPLKVIRGRLSDNEEHDEHEDHLAEPATAHVDAGAGASRSEVAARPADREPAQRSMAFEDAPSPQQRRPERSVPTAAAPRHAPAAPGSTPGSSEPAAGRSRAVPVLAGRPEVSPSATAGTAGRDPAPRGPAPGDTAGRESARGEAAGGPPTAADSGEGGPRRPFPRIPERDERDSLTLEELANEGGVDASLLRQLEQFGLLTAVATVGGAAYYDEDALTLARVAAGFAQHGVEARHLRAWRHAAEREASLFEQIVLPLLRQRNPQSRQQAADTLMELSDLGADLRRLLVRQALRHVH